MVDSWTWFTVNLRKIRVTKYIIPFRSSSSKNRGFVFSSEWDKDCQDTYENNFGDRPLGDITISETQKLIPQKFDILCAGFPCQPFSKGGRQKGFEDTRGTLFFEILQVLKKHKPKFVLLENVQNLVSHHQGETYQTILKCLDQLGYYYPKKPTILSPDKFGVPILRPRLFIPAVRKSLARSKHQKFSIKHFDTEIEKCYQDSVSPISAIIDEDVRDSISLYEKKVIKMWDEFYKGIDIKIIGFPIWVDYFNFSGSMRDLPQWKISFIKKNQHLYKKNKVFINQWLKQYENLKWCANTHKKMEWQAGDDYDSLYDCLIQFRPSGVRVKRPDKFSTLVAMNHRQIIGSLERKISVREAARLQSFPDQYLFLKDDNKSFKQLGNTVNITVVKHVAKLLLNPYLNLK